MRHPFCRYGYSLSPGKPFARYGIEQQAEIVRRAFIDPACDEAACLPFGARNRPAPKTSFGLSLPPVIASPATQSSLCRTHRSGLLRCARNDGPDAPLSIQVKVDRRDDADFLIGTVPCRSVAVAVARADREIALARCLDRADLRPESLANCSAAARASRVAVAIIPGLMLLSLVKL